MTIHYAPRGDIRIAYETFGDAGNPTLLLVQGLATQMLGYDEQFCELFVNEGFHVVRFDNRDIGLSTHLDAAGMPDLTPLFTGEPFPNPPYLLADMADDAVAVLDALGVERAHIAGASMGGMICQQIALDHGDRVISLTSIFSTPSLAAGPSTPEAGKVLLAPAATTEEAAADRAVEIFRVIGSPGYPFDEAGVRAIAIESFRRANDPAGVVRQLVAINASGDRTSGLRSLDMPTLVLHGQDDPLITLPGGIATAEAIAGARLVTYPGMGHDFPSELWPEFVREITALAKSAEPAPTTK
jgi:pimeloyl-ACP methyl ester carboxylesterase